VCAAPSNPLSPPPLQHAETLLQQALQQAAALQHALLLRWRRRK
jgi:hypothetical protein